MAVSPLLQIRLIVRTKDSSTVSLGWMFILLIGYILWFSYGLAFNTVPLIIANSAAVVVGASLIVTVLIYRKPRAVDESISGSDPVGQADSAENYSKVPTSKLG